MLGVIACPDCRERMNVDRNREWKQVRCQKCGRLLSRETDMVKTEVSDGENQD